MASVRSVLSMSAAASCDSRTPSTQCQAARPPFRALLVRAPLQKALLVSHARTVGIMNASARPRINDSSQPGIGPVRPVAESGSTSKGLLAALFALGAAVAFPGAAEAAKSGGRVGGSSFRGARSSYSAGGSSSMGGTIGSSRSSPSWRPSGNTTIITTGPRVSFFPVIPYYGGFGYGGFGFGSTLLTFVVVAAMAYAAAQFFNGPGYEEDYFTANERVTVAKLQIGLLADNRSMQKELERIAGRTDTSDPDGLHFVLTETAIQLLRRPEVWVYGHSEGKVVNGLDEGEQLFNQMSLNERGKFQRETFINYGGRARKSELDGANDGEVDELVVVTILVAYEGNLKLTKCRDREETKEALERLGAAVADQLLAMEILWTPSDPNDAYTRDNIIEDYPQLNTL